MGEFLGAAFRSFSGRILGALSALIAAYTVTSNLTIGDSGLFFLSLGFAIFFSHTLTLGLDNFVLKKCAIYLDQKGYPEFLSIVFVSAAACIAGSITIYLILHASAWVITYKYLSYLLLIFPAGVAAALLGIISHSLHASGFVFTGAITNTSLHYIVFSILVWLLPSTDVNGVIVFFIIACYLALIAQIIVALILYSVRDIKFSEWKNVQLHNVDYHELYRTTLPLWMIIIAQQLNQWGAQFISSVHVSEEDLALLAIATRIALLVPMVLTAVNMVVSPKFAALHHSGELKKTEEVLTKSLKLLAVVSSFIFLFMILLGSNVLSIFGSQYTEAAVLLSILVSGQLVNALTGPCGKLLIMSGFEKDVRNITIIVTAVGLSLALVLVAKYGVYGAAISTALTIATQNLAIAYIVKYRLQISLLKLYSNFFRLSRS